MLDSPYDRRKSIRKIIVSYGFYIESISIEVGFLNNTMLEPSIKFGGNGGIKRYEYLVNPGDWISSMISVTDGKHLR